MNKARQALTEHAEQVPDAEYRDVGHQDRMRSCAVGQVDEDAD
jgi:hypothetical protein